MRKRTRVQSNQKKKNHNNFTKLSANSLRIESCGWEENEEQEEDDDDVEGKKKKKKKIEKTQQDTN